MSNNCSSISFSSLVVEVGVELVVVVVDAVVDVVFAAVVADVDALRVALVVALDFEGTAVASSRLRKRCFMGDGAVCDAQLKTRKKNIT